MHIVKSIIHVDMHLHRCAYHSSEQLCNVCMVRSMAEGHHSFRSRAIPTCGKGFFEEYNLDPLIIRNPGWLDIMDVKPVYLKRGGSFTEGMNDLPLCKPLAGSFFNNPEAIIEVCGRDLPRIAVLNLND